MNSRWAIVTLTPNITPNILQISLKINGLSIKMRLNLLSTKSREDHNPMMIQHALAFLATVLLATSSVALAECPIPETGGAVYNQTSLQMSSGARLTIKGQTLRVEISEGRYFHYSVKQHDSGPPTSIIELSPTRFVVLGPRKSFLGVAAKDYSERDDLSLNPLPVRYDARCSFGTHFWGTCPVASARFSPALQAVVVSGWTHDGSLGTLLVADNDDPKPLELEDGTALAYFWDDYEGNAVLRTRAGDGFLLKQDSEFVKCGLYPPMYDKLYVQ